MNRIQEKLNHCQLSIDVYQEKIMIAKSEKKPQFVIKRLKLRKEIFSDAATMYRSFLRSKNIHSN